MNTSDISNKNIVISYMGGCFGNSLSAIIKTAITGILPNAYSAKSNTFHYQSWPYDVKQCIITETSDFKLSRSLLPGEVVQVHCMNGSILSNRFPTAKKILLTCEKDKEIYAIHRQWSVLSDLSKTKIDLVLDSWDWIVYNLTYYNSNGRILDHNNPLLLNMNFLNFVDQIDKIESFLNIKVSLDKIQPIISHINDQLTNFYIVHESFQFSWDVFSKFGPDAPIVTMANESFKYND